MISRLQMWAGLVAALCSLLPVSEPSAGHDLYERGEGANAHLRGDLTRLPPNAARCANCHEPSRQVSSSDLAFGPRLDARLAVAMPRRGGPPSAHDEASFCKLLRTGVDPGQVLIRRVMPVYDISDAACGDLWRMLSVREPAPGAQP